MKFNMECTLSTYKKIIAEPDREKKSEIFKNELIKPIDGAFKT